MNQGGAPVIFVVGGEQLKTVTNLERIDAVIVRLTFRACHCHDGHITHCDGMSSSVCYVILGLSCGSTHHCENHQLTVTSVFCHLLQKYLI